MSETYLPPGMCDPDDLALDMDAHGVVARRDAVWRREVATLDDQVSAWTRQAHGQQRARTAAEARIATLEADLAREKAQHEEAAKLLGTVVCIGTLADGEELANDPRHAATDAILGWRREALEARADLSRSQAAHEKDLARASEITAGALADRDAARADLARVTGERDEAKDWASFYLQGLTAWQEWAATISPHPGPGEWHGDSFQRDKIKAATTAARRDLEEARRLLDDVKPLIRRFLAEPRTPTFNIERRRDADDWLNRRHAFLSRLKSTPAEPTGT